jgi:hypothetical protein
VSAEEGHEPFLKSVTNCDAAFWRSTVRESTKAKSGFASGSESKIPALYWIFFSSLLSTTLSVERL